MPWMPSPARMLRWIVGSQMLLVQIASNVPTQNSSPTSVLKRFCGLNSCSGTKRMNSLSSSLCACASASASACRRSRTAAKRSGSTMPRRMNTSSSAGTMPT